MADQESLDFKMNVLGQQAASARVRQFAKDVKEMDKAAVGAGSKFGSLAGVVGNLGTVVAGTSPAFGQFAGVIGTAGSAIGGLTSVIGGVGGIVGATLIGSLGAMAVQMLQAKKRTDALNKSMRAATKTTNEFIAAAQKAQSRRALLSRLATATASDLEFEGAIAQEREREQKLSREFEALRQRGLKGESVRQRFLDVTNQLKRSRGRISSLQANRELARREAAQAPELDAEEAAVEAEAQEAQRATQRRSARRTARETDPFATARTDEGFFRGLAQEGLNVGRKQKFDVEFTDRAKSAVEAERRIQEAVRETAQVRQEASALALSGAQESITQMILGNEMGAKAALKATGDALVGQGVKHGFEAAAMAVIPGAQGNAATLFAIAAAEIVAGKAMGALFAAPSQPAASPSRASARRSQDQGLFVQVNVNPITGEQIVKTMRGERRKRGDNAVAF